MGENKIIILTVVLIIICGCLIGVISLVSASNDVNIITEGDVNEVVASVNGEDIKRLDVNYRRYINKSANKSNGDNQMDVDFDKVKEEVINNKVLVAQAKKENVDLEESEKQELRDSFTNSVTDGDRRVAQKLGMSEDEYLNYVVDRQLEEKLAMKMTNQIYDKLTKGEISLENDEFKKCMEAYNKYASEDKNEEINQRMNSLERAYEIYLEDLRNHQ